MLNVTQKPEELYRKTTDKSERRRLRTAVLEAYRVHVRAYVSKRLPFQHREEAEQVGLIGLWYALEKYEPEKCCKVGGDRGAAFWNFARRYVRDEIRKWMDRGVYWRPVRKKGDTDLEQDRRLALAQRSTDSMDAPLTPSGDDFESTLHDIHSSGTNPEELAAEREEHDRLTRYVACLDNSEIAALLPLSARGGARRGAGFQTKPERHLTLVRNASAFVRGQDGESQDIDGGRAPSSRPL